jgi:Polyphosphate kinase 2 (PPK2)
MLNPSIARTMPRRRWVAPAAPRAAIGSTACAAPFRPLRENTQDARFQAPSAAASVGRITAPVMLARDHSVQLRAARGGPNLARAASARAADRIGHDVKGKQARRMKRTAYEQALTRLQAQLCHLQQWVKEKGLRAIILFEGRDGAGATVPKKIDDPRRQWKLSPMALSSRERWYDYSRARELMFKKTDTAFAPWYVVRSDDKRAARLNTLRHVLSTIPYKRLRSPRVELSDRAEKKAYNDRKSIAKRRVVEEY